MGRSVRELLDSMDAAELHDWMEFYEAEPWGEDRADLRAGIVAATVAGCHGIKCRPSDFLPQYDREREPMSDDDIQSTVVKTNAMLGGSFVKR